jgi:putative oxidoreductase
MERVAGVGLPSALAYLVYAGEVVAPLLLIVGIWTRAAALIVSTNMVVAVLLVHTGQLRELNRFGGWALELQGFYFFVAVAIMLLGAGKFSVGGASGKLNLRSCRLLNGKIREIGVPLNTSHDLNVLRFTGDLTISPSCLFLASLGVNLKTAKALGITVPQSLVSRADRVIPQ